MNPENKTSRLFAHLSDDQVQAYSLALAASGIEHRIKKTNGGWQICIASCYRRDAIKVISLYLAENYPPSKRTEPYPTDWKDRSVSAFYVAGLLLFIHWLIPEYDRPLFERAFGADSQLILNGQLYRCVTALLLHADWAHVLSNSVGLLLFGTVCAAMYGWGVGWLLIVSAGATGNLATAWFYESGHLAIGASTALFAAVGMSAAMNLMFYLRSRRRSWRTWTPIAGGMALLALLGAAPHTDVLAHLFGFISGFLMGALYAKRRPAPLDTRWQAAAWLAVFLLTAGCWIIGMYVNP